MNFGNEINPPMKNGEKNLLMKGVYGQSTD
jgi:hypothetical protein